MTAQRWRVALWLSMLALVLWIAWSARLALFPFLVGALIAYAVTPIVDRLASLIPARTRQHDKIRRGVVVLVIYVAFFGSLTGVGVAIVPVAVNQAVEFFNQLPEIVEDARMEVTEWVSAYQTHLPERMRTQIDGYTEDFGNTAAEVAGDMAAGAIERITGAIPVVVGFLIVPFWMFYALRDRHFVERNFMRAVPEPFQKDILNIARIGDYLLGRYIRAQLLLALIVGVSIGVAMTLLGVPFSIGLGLWAGITEMIPILGPWLGAIAGILVVLATEPGLVIWVALIYFVVQQVENSILVPRIQGQAVDIHPAMIITLLAVAASTVGLIGMLFVVPLVAILRELFWYADRRLAGTAPEAAFDESHVGQRRRDRPLDARLGEPANVAAEDAVIEAETESPSASADGAAADGVDTDAVDTTAEKADVPASARTD